MPELPEVETIRSQISKFVPFKILAAEYSAVADSIIKHREFALKNVIVESMKRKGKCLIFECNKNRVALSHLGMTGAWVFSKETNAAKHAHIKLKIKNCENYIEYLSYVDPRRFGTFHLYAKEQARVHLNRIGVDISSTDFTEDYVLEVIKKFPQRQIKVHLLDQKYFAGSGNYIANEICAHAGIRPARRNKTLTRNDISNLYRSTIKVIKGAIDSKGVTFQGGYQDAFGEKGEGVKGLVVFYQDICQLCQKNKVKKILLAQRGTYYCSDCQK